MNGIRIGEERGNCALVIPRRDRPLSGNAAGEGRADDVFIQCVRRFRLHVEVLRRRHGRRFVHESFRLRIGMHSADRCTNACRRAARKTAHDILHGKGVVCVDRDIAACINGGAIPDFCERSFVPCAVRCLGRKGSAKTRFHFIERLGIICTDGFVSTFVDFLEFAIYPAVKADSFAIFVRLAGERRLVFRRHGAPDIINRDTACKTKGTNRRRNRIRLNVMHVIFCIDGHISACRYLISIAKERIRLGLDICYVDSRAY